MAFLDDVVRKTQKAGQVIADKATDVYDYTKTSFNIASLENKLNEKLIAIGTFVLNGKEGKEQDENILAALLDEAAALKNQISAVKAERGEIRNQVICPACGKENAKSSAYCTACGTKLND